MLIDIFISFALATETPKCPKPFEPEALKMSLETKAGLRLDVCGEEDPAPIAGDKRTLLGFKIFNGTKKVFSTRGGERYWVAKTADGVKLEELLFVDGVFHPTYESEIICTKKGCQQGPVRCVFKKLESPPERALEEIHPYIAGPKKGQVPDENLIGALAELALSGNEKAQAFFAKRPKGLVLDGASGETYEDDQEILRRLKKSKCL